MGREGRGLIPSSILENELRPGLAPGRSGRSRTRPSLAWLGITPFVAYTLLFLFIPAGTVMVGAFKGEKGGFTFSNITSLVSERPLRHAYWLSIEVSLVTALLGALFGLLLAYACVRKGAPQWIRSAFTTFSGVAANFGGIPLAFAFIATLGALGIVTQFFQNQLGINLYANGFSLFTKTGVEITYLYFQIPLMFLVIAPALDGLRHEWREAASNLGANTFQFWRSIGLPILFPSILGAIILLFGNAFAAYATAYALASSSLNLVPILIGADLRGNVYTNPHEGQALAFGMFVVLAVMMVVYIPLQRRASRWAK